MQYTLMHQRIPVLRIEINETEGSICETGSLFAPAHLPVGVSCEQGRINLQDLNDWWMGRAIRPSRPGLCEALAFLGLDSPQLLRAKCHGLSLTDQYWIRPAETPDKRWEEINFFDHAYSEDMGNLLFGTLPQQEPMQLLSPDNTTDGWLPKRWLMQGGKRFLLKGGSEEGHQQEPYNEVLASAVMRRLGVPHASYTLTERNALPYSLCENLITAETELVSAEFILRTLPREEDSWDLQHYLNCCAALGIPGMRRSMDQLLTVDFIIANEDRHGKNFGAVRHAETLAWLGAAPVFDSGSCLWYETPTAQIQPQEDRPAKPFRKSHARQIQLVSSFDWLNLSALQGIEEEYRELLRPSPHVNSNRLDALCQGLRCRVETLAKLVSTRCCFLQQQML